ncbi:MAG: 5'-nucleotidase [Methylococcaceae bacterium]
MLLKQFLRIFHPICPSWSGYYGGASAYRNIPAIEAHLFLSANADDVAKTLNAGCAAAIILCAVWHYKPENFLSQVSILIKDIRPPQRLSLDK